jgi:hypothetical protein
VNADFESLRMRCVGCAVWTNVIVDMVGLGIGVVCERLNGP